MTTRYYRNHPPVIGILGATATGKTGTAIRLAQQSDGEVVSVDSRYLYRGLDIGTAKPTPEERQRVPHHLIDILDPDDDYSLALFQRDAFAAIDDILTRGHLPILAGGSPLYVRALLEGWRIPEAPPDPAFRAEMERLASEKGRESLHSRLREIDPVAATRTPPNNLRRVIRALEVHHVTGQRMSDLEGKDPPPYRFLRIGLHLDREVLYERIDQRVDQMLEQGLVDEVRGLVESGVSLDSTAMRSIGYQEVIPYLRGEYDHETMAQRIKHSTHRYVRHQMTWLRKTADICWIEVSEPDAYEEILKLVRQFTEK